jgi:hypothetical protein
MCDLTLLAATNGSERRASAAVMPPLVFLGPSLKRAEAASLIAAEFRPPARRGDIYRALIDGYTTIVLIDGEFHGQPSVWQREIVDAMFEGAAVHGASSMGALRAAELHSLGMAGHGRIFAWYRDGVIDGDDEVALTYGPAELGYPALSEPLVNIRATLAAAVPRIITAEEHTMLLESVRRLYFPDRSFAALLDASPATKWPAVRRDALSRFLVEQRIDQKRLDAIAALTTVASGDAGEPSTSNPRIAAALVSTRAARCRRFCPSLGGARRCRDRAAGRHRRRTATSHETGSIDTLLCWRMGTLSRDRRYG